ncbi:hypothetical protein JCM10296v2_004809 [Rhodotorula toruloides]
MAPTVPQTPPAPRYRTQNYRGNARGLGKQDHPEGSSNYALLQGFEWYQEGGGKYYAWLAGKAKELGEMGITAIWIPPPTKADGPNSVGYSIYDLWDLGEFDQKGGKATKWGTKDELLECVKKLKENGIVVYIDAVLNHKAGADYTEPFHATEVDWDDRTKEISDLYEIEGWTGFNFPGRKGKYSEMIWSHIHFTGVDWDDKGKKKAIFKIQGEGKTWAENVDKEKGIKETGAAGFRFDAVKHIDEGFIADFVREVRERLDNPDMFCVGEFWKSDLGALEGYLDRFPEQFSCFDVTLHDNFHRAGAEAESFDLRSILDNSLVRSRPMDAVTVVCNHDTQPTQALEAPVAPWFAPLAYCLTLLRAEGYPCVFGGDLWGCKSEPAVEPISGLAELVKARRWFAYGPTRDYWDHANCLGWIREGDADHDGCAVVICNGTGEGEKRMQVQGNNEHKGEKWIDVLGWTQGEVEIEEDGWATFKCPSKSVAVWVRKDARGLETFGKK